MIEVFDDIEQGSPEWYQVRLGIPTASEFKTLLGIKKDAREKVTRQTYMMKLAGEIITGEPMESYSNGHMERGKANEDAARETYAFINDAPIRRVGFIRNGQKGYSPDSLVGESGCLEIKSAAAHIQIDRLLKNELPSEHKAQCYGGLLVAEREWCDFVSDCPGLPQFRFRVYRDEEYIRQISDAVDAFNDELAALVNRIRCYQEPPRAVVREQLRQSVLLAG